MQVNGTQIVITVVSLLFTAVIAPLVRAALQWLKGRTRSEALKTALTEAQTVADNVVAGLEATVVTALKEKSEDGKLCADDARVVASMAVDAVLRDLSTQTLAVLKDNAEDISVYISNLIEARLARYQKQGG